MSTGVDGDPELVQAAFYALIDQPGADTFALTFLSDGHRERFIVRDTSYQSSACGAEPRAPPPGGIERMAPVPKDPSIEAKIADITFNLKVVGVEIGTPEFNLKSLSGQIDIGISGKISVMNQTIASASGVVSTKGIGMCGGLLGVSVGFGQPWGGDATFYSSRCSTDQLRVTS